MKEQWFKFVVDRPVIVIILSLLLIMSAGYGMQKLVFKGDYRVFFGETNPQLIAFEEMQKAYNKNDTVDFVIAPKNGQVFTPEVMQMVLDITQESWQIPFSTRVDSISNFQHTYAVEDDMIVEDLLSSEAQKTVQKLAEIKQIAITDPLLVNRLISKQAHVTIITTTVQLPGLDATTEVPQIVEFVREMKSKYHAKYPDVDIYLSGIIMMNNSFAESSLNDGKNLIPVMFLAIIVMMILTLKSITGTIATVFVIAGSIVGAMGLAGWAGLYLTGPSASTPTMVMTLAVADCIHILTSQFYEMRRGTAKREALLNSLQINFQPIFLTSITTAIGFLSLNFSDAPPFQDLGNMVATGVMLAFFLSISLFPAMLSLLPVKVKPHEAGKKDYMEKLSHFVIRHRIKLLPISSAVIMALVIFVPSNDLNDNFVEYFDKTVAFRDATDYMQENIRGLSSISYSIKSGEASGVNKPDFLQVTENFANWLRVQPETDHVLSITDTIKRLNKNMHADDEAYYKLPENQELSAQYLLLYEMSLPYGLDLNNQLNVDKSGTRLIATFKNLTSNQMLDMERRSLKWFSKNGNGYTLEAASPNLMFAHIGQRNIVSMLSGTTVALILISAILGVALRSARFGFISLLPNLAPAGIAFGIWGIFVGEVGLALSVVAGMTLGIIVDDTVHFLSKYLHARRDKGYDAVEAVHYAFASVGRALWITTLVLSFGFMVLAQSTFRLNADMGLLTAVTITIALIVDFLFLPPLLMLIDKKQPQETQETNEFQPLLNETILQETK
ncbi:MMPL family transporter [Candidatus Venteria ishoeyi]|uniref:efflux RND transporter permease subunit n=1 Tax=Candidatus Venteria ishoeyi TaxID=1899563 RepID=UPI0025A548CA|nr:MMPL family transporter [Candidatus Venteria ishoeyi]MDM8546072.1 MMPL family transporter [Candidatus Venteria ishoeyi]